MRRIDGINDEDKTQFDSIKAEFQSYLGYDCENKRPMCMHPAVLEKKDSIDKESVKTMTDADFLALMIDVWQCTEFPKIFETVWASESFCKFKSTLIEKD